MSTVALVGDVGGHAHQLDMALRGLGLTPSSWPAELHVIQVGDLIGGVDDHAVLDIVEPHTSAPAEDPSPRKLGQSCYRWTRLPSQTAQRARPGLRATHRQMARRRRHSIRHHRDHAGRRHRCRHTRRRHGNLWQHELNSEFDARRAADMINTLNCEAIHRSGIMLSAVNQSLGVGPTAKAPTATPPTSWPRSSSIRLPIPARRVSRCTRRAHLRCVGRGHGQPSPDPPRT
jgi:hypothetical protein